MPDSQPTPNWQPISFLPNIAEMIDGMLESAQNVYGSLQQARSRPHVMDDDTIGRVREVHGAQLDDLWLYEAQLSPWQTPAPSEAQQQEITRLNRQLAELRGVLTATLALADDTKDSTIEKIMAKDDFELGLDFLMGKHRLK
jgi:hypothetical protein